MLHQKLSQKQLQRLSPQQIQLMKLLQVPTAQLEQRIKEELESNPALEEGSNEQEEFDAQEPENTKAEEKDEQVATDELEDIDLSEYYDDDDIPDYKTRSNNYSADDEDKEYPVSVQSTFHEYLVDQVGLLNLDEQEEKIALQIVGSIDDDGYLRRDAAAITDDLAFGQNIIVNADEVNEIIQQIQQFDPPGVAAQNLQECLMIQLEKANENIIIKKAKQVIGKYFELFSKKHYDKLQKQLDLDEDELKIVLDEILKLNPKPGSAYASSSKERQYITPDFFLNNKNGELELTLNGRNAPELSVSRDYKDMLEAYDKSENSKNSNEKQAVLFIKQKIDAARWFIDAIQQRQQTLLKTMQSLMKKQYDFFISGDETKLKPMILKDIAEMTNLDISTISRVANSKYVQTEFGIYPLKYFFSESISTDSGEEVSTREVKSILSDMIEAENKKKPLSDQKLMEGLKEKGYNIARRTVAKYREQLGIPVARLRKEL
ncbi:MAG: RNA polymerase factor sigma-54 [Chitinophagales bacterium]